MHLRRTATEAQLGVAFEFASPIEFLIELELQFELEIQFEFEFEFRFEFEFEFEFDIDFEFRFEFKFEFEFELQFEFTFALAFEKPNFSLRENNSGPLSGAGNSTSVGILRDPSKLAQIHCGSPDPGLAVPAGPAAARAPPPHPLDTFGGLRTNFSSHSLSASFRNQR